MRKKVLFLDSVEKSDGSYNVTYGTDDINAIVRSLTGAGVSIFPSGETFNVSDLNSITEAMVSEGVSFDGLRVSLSNGKIHIAPGTGFFENGAIITVDADGEDVEYKVSENVYVYAEYDKTLNVCDFRTSEEAPSEAEGVFRLMLAVIEADGTVTDKRAVAQSKVASIGKNVFLMLYEVTSQTTLNAGTVLYEEEIDLSKFNNLVCYVKYNTNESYIRAGVEALMAGEVVKTTSNTVKDPSIAAQIVDGKLKVFVTERISGYGYSSTAVRAEIYLC